MKKNKKIIKKNTEAINEFLSWNGKNTGKRMSEFIFELQSCYLSQPGPHLTKKGASDAVTLFSILYRLVNDIKPVV